MNIHSICTINSTTILLEVSYNTITAFRRRVSATIHLCLFDLLVGDPWVLLRDFVVKPALTMSNMPFELNGKIVWKEQYFEYHPRIASISKGKQRLHVTHQFVGEIWGPAGCRCRPRCSMSLRTPTCDVQH